MGTALAVGGTTLSVNHNLIRTPTVDEISIMQSANTTTDVGFWYVNTIGGTSFTVNVVTAPGAGGFVFGWKAQIKLPFTA